jgi:hypothetical protein
MPGRRADEPACGGRAGTDMAKTAGESQSQTAFGKRAAKLSDDGLGFFQRPRSIGANPTKLPYTLLCIGATAEIALNC